MKASWQKPGTGLAKLGPAVESPRPSDPGQRRRPLSLPPPARPLAALSRSRSRSSEILHRRACHPQFAGLEPVAENHGGEIVRKVQTLPRQSMLDAFARGRRGGGRSGIRTHGELAPTPVFKTGALNRSAILPRRAEALFCLWRRGGASQRRDVRLTMTVPARFSFARLMSRHWCCVWVLPR